MSVWKCSMIPQTSETSIISQAGTHVSEFRTRLPVDAVLKGPSLGKRQDYPKWFRLTR